MLDVLAGEGAARVTVQVVAEPQKMTRVPDAIQFLKKNGLTFDQNLSAIRHGVALGLKMGAAIIEPEHVSPLIDAGASFFKILSADITYEALLLAAATTGLPVYVSTGA